jgi:hypothetical protein
MGFFVEAMAAWGYQGRAQWDPAFYAYAGVVLAGAIGWLFIDATRSVLAPPQASTWSAWPLSAAASGSTWRRRGRWG